MSTSLLYHAFGVRGYRLLRSVFSNGEVLFEIEEQRDKLECSCCGSSDVIRRGTVTRFFRSVGIGSKPVTISCPIQRVECRQCDVVRQVKVRFADPKRTYTRSFERYAKELCRVMTIKDVSQHLGVSWDVIKDIHKTDLKRRFKKRRLKGLKQIAIDEISIGKNHRYLTVVLDLQSGAVVYVGDGKGADALDPFWKSLRSSGAQVEAVAIDMSPAYWSAVQNNLPDSTIVFDHFHVIKLYNEKLSDLRRSLYHDLTETLDKKVLKGTRWLLLKNPENLDESRAESQRLEEALQLNEPLAAAYYMKEDLRRLWNQGSKEDAEDLLADWIALAEESGVQMLKKFAKTLAAHRSGILAYYDYRISTGPLEGTNNKIKTLQRRSYGFRDQEYFKYRIYAAHESKYALVG